MIKCKHKCNKCNETWECSYPYYSDYQFFGTAVNNGYYCNSYCPSCQREKRKEIDQMFGNMSETGYTVSFFTKIEEKT